MGRGGNRQDVAESVSSRGASANSTLMDEVNGLERRMALQYANYVKAASDGSFEDQLRAKATATRSLNKNVPAQKMLIQVAQRCSEIEASEETDDAARNRARVIGERAREIFIVSNQGYVINEARKQLGAFDNEDSGTTIEIMSQEARTGLNDTVNDYTFTYVDENGIECKRESNPLTFAVHKVRNRISDAREKGQSIRVKSKANDEAQKVKAIARDIENRGEMVTVAEISDRLDMAPERVARYLEVTATMARLDAPIGDPSDGGTLGSFLGDDSLSSMEDHVDDIQLKKAVRSAIDDLPSPLARALFSMHYGINESGEAKIQTVLFDGVYADKDGNQFTAETSVFSERSKRGEKIERKSQSWLNEKFKSGEVDFIAGTEESFELARIKKSEKDGGTGRISRDEIVERRITHLTGMPITSGNVQHIMRSNERRLLDNPAFGGINVRYRGPDALENSKSARDTVRRALIASGMSAKEVDKLKAGRSRKDGSDASKQPLRELAEKRNLVDSTGRLNNDRIEQLLAQAS